ncbi:MAG: hypothetical protein KF777_15880 [Planctomycetaceae bacterium]|nr:hypothetical protein [Planctomycetaceae bacterium]
MLLIAIASCLCPAIYLAVGMLPTVWANARPHRMRGLAQGASLLAVGLAGLCLFGVATSRSTEATFLRANVGIELTLGVYVDPLAATMLLLITGLGWVVTRFAARYLDGEPSQGRFMKWMCLTLAAVLTLVISRNVLMFTCAWVLTSLSLHQLLTHYRDRPAALVSARKKFLISRFGDLALLIALILIGRTFGSFEYDVLFAQAGDLAKTADGGMTLAWIGFLYVLGAMTKSSQFPLHSWLPDTMETPTPVSALMHAGIINAGGFLVLRFSPLIVHSTWGLDFLALIGGVTAIFGAVVMLAQTSVKRSLAFSTIAQMGFMMLQCGLGAYPAALLHIVAHSCYKAHAFLSSGSVLEYAAARRAPLSLPTLSREKLLLASAAAAFAVTVVTPWIWRTSPIEKPGGVILLLVMFLAVTHLIQKISRVRDRICPPDALAAGLAVGTAYFGLYLMFDRWLGDSLARPTPDAHLRDYVLIALVSVGFLGVFWLQWMLDTPHGRFRLRGLYVHASRGFYLDLPLQRLVARVWKTQLTA